MHKKMERCEGNNDGCSNSSKINGNKREMLSPFFYLNMFLSTHEYEYHLVVVKVEVDARKCLSQYDKLIFIVLFGIGKFAHTSIRTTF